MKYDVCVLTGNQIRRLPGEFKYTFNTKWIGVKY